MGLRVLLISNGHGEDAIGALLARHLRGEGLHITAFPLLGAGHAYRADGIPLIGQAAVLPSGGFARLGWEQFWGDVRAGMVGSLLRQARTLRDVASQFDYGVAIGDIIPLTLGAWGLRRPLVFHSTAKSDFIAGHLKIEETLMRRHCRLVFARDERTARTLSARGVPARFVGNLMMDMIPVARVSLPVSPSDKFVALLPGSRQDAYDNLLTMLGALPALVEGGGGDVGDSVSSHRSRCSPSARWVFGVALAPGLQLDVIRRQAEAAGWRWVAPSPAAGRAEASEEEANGSHIPALLQQGAVEVVLVRGGFGDVLQRADACIGLAGTANEQAVGLGKPVVAFPGQGVQFTPRFLAAQKRLLGEGLIVVEPHPKAIARGVWRAVMDSDVRERARLAGRERMGSPGGAARMAEALRELWNLSSQAHSA